MPTLIDRIPVEARDIIYDHLNVGYPHYKITAAWGFSPDSGAVKTILRSETHLESPELANLRLVCRLLAYEIPGSRAWDSALESDQARTIEFCDKSSALVRAHDTAEQFERKQVITAYMQFKNGASLWPSVSLKRVPHLVEHDTKILHRVEKVIIRYSEARQPLPAMVFQLQNLSELYISSLNSTPIPQNEFDLIASQKDNGFRSICRASTIVSLLIRWTQDAFKSNLYDPRDVAAKTADEVREELPWCIELNYRSVPPAGVKNMNPATMLPDDQVDILRVVVNLRQKKIISRVRFKTKQPESSSWIEQLYHDSTSKFK